MGIICMLRTGNLDIGWKEWIEQGSGSERKSMKELV